MNPATAARDAIFAHLATLDAAPVSTVAVGDESVIVRVDGDPDAVFVVRLTISKA